MQDAREFEQQQAHIASAQHCADFLRHHPEYLTAAVLRATVYRTRVGKKPAFPSSHDAVQYERGFIEFPNQPWGLMNSPRMQGYLDAEEAHAQALLAQANRRASDFGELA